MGGLGAFFFVMFLLGIVGVALFLIPTFVAVKRNHPDKLPIVLVNIFLGASVVGWVVALIWALSNGRGSDSR